MDQANDDQPPARPRSADDAGPDGTVPGVVLAAVLLMCIGGGALVLDAATGQSGGDPVRGLRALAYALYGLVYVVLGWAIYRRRRWARVAVLALCWVGFGLALVRLTVGLAAAVTTAVWPLVYLILLSRPAARAWVRGARPESSGAAPVL